MMYGTEKQDSFIRSLMAERDQNPEVQQLKRNLAAMDRIPPRVASAAIDTLKQIDRNPMYGPDRLSIVVAKIDEVEQSEALMRAFGETQTERRTGDELLDGRFALPACVAHSRPKDPLKPVFYKVDRPKKGKWAGYTFVKQIVGGGFRGEEDGIRLNRQEQAQALEIIAEDALAARLLYGHEIGRCGHCGRQLTSEWRKKGIGPVCAQKANVRFQDLPSFNRDMPIPAAWQKRGLTEEMWAYLMENPIVREDVLA